MKAITHDRYGSADTLELREVATPSPPADAVVVRIQAAGVNRGDGLAVAGIPYAARLSYGLTRPKHRVPGTDVAGIVEAVGENVTAFAPGDEVFGWADGAFAEYGSAEAGMLVPKPERVAFEHAAATPSAAVAALQALRNVGNVEAGQQVLVVGASGGVGTFAVQIAKAMGAEVTAVAGGRNADLVRSAGADHVIDYTRRDFTRDVERYDVVVDLVGREPLTSSRKTLRPGGTYVVVGGPKPRSLTGMSRFVGAMLLSPFVRQRLRPLFAKPDRADLEYVAALLDAGKLLPVIDSVYDLHDAADAVGYVQAGHARGKVVVTV
jgi:NADPH:quinone reductase-like Zn-dependent oxidoreductase